MSIIGAKGDHLNRPLKFRTFRSWRGIDGERKHKMKYFDGRALWGALGTTDHRYDGSGPEPGDPVMQFTGLKDSEGQKIYEGDVIRWPDGTPAPPCVVRYERGAFIADPIGGANYGSWSFPEFPNNLLSQLPDTMSVVGNIYENPELIEEDA